MGDKHSQELILLLDAWNQLSGIFLRVVRSQEVLTHLAPSLWMEKQPEVYGIQITRVLRKQLQEKTYGRLNRGREKVSFFPQTR